ncbi:MAG: NYN domain-containing protein [Clostridia bacterium]|nr:NYN domain-containing protein [Clostridia bacterium]
MKKKLIIGILAHVDAGKTTLSEALLYRSGKIRKQGRVDHKNTYLDTHIVERERGITIFSKQARFSTENCEFILLDTPGHVDFSAETERTLSLLDYAVLVISAPEGVQNHTRTLWQLLEFYQVPTFIFVNKTDISVRMREQTEEELGKMLSSHCATFAENQTKEELYEKLAFVHEDFLESFLSETPIEDEAIAQKISSRKLFPCIFGSALRLEGVDFFLQCMDRYMLESVYEEQKFSARVYKIAHADSVRLTYMKITGGTLSVREELSYLSADGKKYTEKISMIRLYSGDKFEQADAVGAGEICAVSGLSATYAGQGLGTESDACKPILEPVLSYCIGLPPECDVNVYFPKLKELEEEEPSLHLYWNESLRQIEAALMGDMQTELLQRLIRDRFGIHCELDAGRILYKEKAEKQAIGIGHFEPLRHYAEVQLLLEPLPKGSGLIFDTRLSENSLDLNWQRLILSHLYEKEHRGILTGASLTDTKITLIAGKAHLKHTEGGDFREATFRAVRHGLMRAGCVLLEPYYRFRLEIPSTNVGRAVSDLQAKSADFEIEASDGVFTQIHGRAPVSELHGYMREVIAYTKGQGKLFCAADGYEPCHNSEEVILASGYDPEADLANPPHSVFCAQGAGFTVLWQDVEAYKHLDVKITEDGAPVIPKISVLANRYHLSDEELEAIMLREFGPIRRKRYTEPKIITAGKSEKNRKPKEVKPQKKLLIIDGYNVIFAWDSLKKIAESNLEEARDRLVDILDNYTAYTKTELILVFDAYRVKDGKGSDFQKDGFRIIFTKQDQTADTFIEILMNEMGPNYNIRVVTADRLLQNSAVLSGILRMTPKELETEITAVGKEITEFVRKLSQKI